MDKKVIVISSLLTITAIIGASGIYAYNSSFVSSNDAVIEPDFIAVDAENSGKVKNIFVKPEQNVTRGQVLAEIEVVENVVVPAKVKSGSDVNATKAKLNDIASDESIVLPQALCLAS